MKKHTTMEIIAILSLSLLLTATLSISGIIPSLIKEFPDYSRSSIELLVSVSSIATTIMVGLNPFISRFLSEQVSVTVGLLMVGLAGVAPLGLSTYEEILIARILVGIGIGLLNTRAVSLIGERFTGAQRSKLLGFRGSAETLGQTVLTIISGQLLLISWNSSFLIYSVAFLVLFLYWGFVPKDEKLTLEKDLTAASKSNHHLNKEQAKIIALHALLANILITVTVSTIIRVPSMITELNIGTMLQANRMISIFMFAGFLSGIVFGQVMTYFKKNVIPLFLFLSAVGLLMIGLFSQIFLISIGAFIVGFALSICVAWVFNSLSNVLPKEVLSTGNSIALFGSNLGAAITPFVLKLIGFINDDLRFSFIFQAVVLIAIAVLILFTIRKKED
ncbi:MFS transporter [Vagococcus silagei]|nr:MFS transporter [Vagococcus silagei]